MELRIQEKMIKVLITLIIISLLGYLGKKYLFKDEDKEVISKFVYNFSLPALVFYSIYTSPPQISSFKVVITEWITSFLIGAISILLGFILKLNKRTIASLFLVSVGGNVTFMGYPIMERLFGNQGLTLAILFDQLGMIIFIYTIGILVINLLVSSEDTKGSIGLWKILQNPPLWALLAGFLFQKINIPDFILDSFSILGRATTPLMMFLLGLSLSKPYKDNKSILGVSFGLFLKLILFPLFSLFIAKLLNLSGIPLKVTVLESAMPSMLTALVLAIQFNLDYVFASQTITYSTLFSLITLNLWIGVIK